MRRRNLEGLGGRGFSLVELVVTMAIMTIVGVAVTSFLIISQKNYNSGSADSALQYEAQLLVNRLQDLMIGASRGISYTYVKELAGGTLSPDEYLKDDSGIEAGAKVNTKSLFIYNADKYYKLVWNQEESRVYYSEYKPDGTPETENNLLAECVTGFKVDLRDVPDNKTVEYAVVLMKEGTGKSYSTSHKIKLRNEILVNATPVELYPPEAGEAKPTKIALYPGSVTLWPGEETQLSAQVTTDTGAIPSQTVIWELEQAGDPSTAVNSAQRLLLGAGERGNTENRLYVKAHKMLEDGSRLDSANKVEVNVRQITGITASDNKGNLSGAEPAALKKGTTGVLIRADITGRYLSDLNTAEEKGGVKITVTQGEEHLTNLRVNETDGTVVFDVKPDVPVSPGVKPRVVIHFAARRAGFESSVCDMTYELLPAVDMSIASGVWRRNGTAEVTLENVDEGILVREGGKVSLRGGGLVTARVTVRSVYSTAEETVYRFDSGGTDPGGTCPVRITFDPDNVLKLKAELPAGGFSYSSPYTAGGIGEWVSADIKSIELEVDLGGHQKASAVYEVEDVIIQYRSALPEDPDGAWTAAQGGVHTIYVTPDDTADTRSVYFSLSQGWDPGNSAYQLRKERFVGKVLDRDGNAIQSGKKEDLRHDLVIEIGDKLSNRVDFKMPGKEERDRLVGRRIREIYEYNPFYGDAYPSQSPGKDRFDRIEGCDGAVEFRFVEGNIYMDPGNKWPGSMYCPRPAELEAGISYYYINPDERFHVYTENGTERAEYQTRNGGAWRTEWSREYHGEYSLWVPID